MLPGVCLSLHRKKRRGGWREKRRLSTRLMCWHTVTHRLNPKLFFFFFCKAKEREGGEFMALQLLALVTVNWPLSGAVKVFYGLLFVPGLCQGSHLWGEQSYWWPRRASPHLATELRSSKTTGPRLLVVTFSSVPLARPHPLLFTFPSRLLLYLFTYFFFFLKSPLHPRTDRQSFSVKPGSPALLIYEQTLWVAPCHWEGTSTTKDSCLLQSTIDFHHSERKTFMEETNKQKKKRGFSNNLRKLTKNFIYIAETIVYRGNLFFCVCKFVITGLFLPIFI